MTKLTKSRFSLDRRTLLATMATGAAALSVPAQARKAAAGTDRPNVIVVYVDDLGYGDIEPFGGTLIKTPNLSQMAREGVCLTDYYAPANLCTPSRAGMLTGRYPIRTGLARGVIMQNDKRELPLSETTVAEILRPAYATALIGKWHLGNPGGASWPPTKHGFDLFHGIQYSHDMSPLSLWEATKAGVSENSKVDRPSLQQDFLQRAIRFIDDNRTRPFFLALTLSAPHLPNYALAPYAGKSQAGAYGDAVSEVDDIVGRLFAHLEALGIDQRTLVLFTSDNGPWFEGSAGAMRERKGGGGYDGASRVPFIARQPGNLAGGGRHDAIAMGIDILPTVVAAAGMELPSGLLLDGRDIGTVLRSGAASPHEELLMFNDEDVVGIRTQDWKYIEDAYYRNYYFPVSQRGYPQLYDPKMGAENYSVAALHPDIVSQMQARLADARARFAPLRTGPSEMPNIPRPAREVMPELWRDPS